PNQDTGCAHSPPRRPQGRTGPKVSCGLSLPGIVRSERKPVLVVCAAARSRNGQGRRAYVLHPRVCPSRAGPAGPERAPSITFPPPVDSPHLNCNQGQLVNSSTRQLVKNVRHLGGLSIDLACHMPDRLVPLIHEESPRLERAETSPHPGGSVY